MPLRSSSLGAATEPEVVEIDARWTTAFAAGLGDTASVYLDTAREGGIVAHPLFPVCFEWPVFLALHGAGGGNGLTAEERRRGVHASHELTLHRPIRPGDRLSTVARVTRIEKRRSGAWQLVGLETVDDEGKPVCTTLYGTLYRGVDTDAAPSERAAAADPLPQTGGHEVPIPIPSTLAHVYTECSRIWNPIHTDPRVARSAGLPGIILHGTATLALAVSRIVEGAVGGDPARVERVAARFGAMVPVPSEVVLRWVPRDDRAVGFEVANRRGGRAIRDGVVSFREHR